MSQARLLSQVGAAGPVSSVASGTITYDPTLLVQEPLRGLAIIVAAWSAAAQTAPTFAGAVLNEAPTLVTSRSFAGDGTTVPVGQTLYLWVFTARTTATPSAITATLSASASIEAWIGVCAIERSICWTATVPTDHAVTAAASAQTTTGVTGLQNTVPSVANSFLDVLYTAAGSAHMFGGQLPNLLATQTISSGQISIEAFSVASARSTAEWQWTGSSIVIVAALEVGDVSDQAAMLGSITSRTTGNVYTLNRVDTGLYEAVKTVPAVVTAQETPPGVAWATAVTDLATILAAGGPAANASSGMTGIPYGHLAPAVVGPSQYHYALSFDPVSGDWQIFATAGPVRSLLGAADTLATTLGLISTALIAEGAN
jgi:hypothetical protein